MIEKKKRKSKAIIISIIAMVILGLIIFLIYKNRDRLFPSNEISENIIPFQSLFGTSQKKGLEIVDSLQSNKNPSKTSAQAGEDIKKGDILKIVGYNSNGDPIVIVIRNTSEIKDYSDIFGIAEYDFNNGNIGSVIIPDMSEYMNFWDKIGEWGENFKEWLGKFINPFANPDDFLNDDIKNPIVPNLNTPKVTVTADKTRINPGEKATISWVSENTTSCDIGNGFVEPTSGSIETETLYGGKFYSILCEGTENTGIVSGGVYIGVTGKDIAESKIPKVTVTADKTRINPGEKATISWVSENTTSCDIGNGFVEPTSGSIETETLYDSKFYSILCEGTENTGIISGGVYINVNIDMNIPMIKFVKAKPQIINPGEYSTISWSSSNTDYCEVYGLNFECTKDGNKTNCEKYKEGDSNFECKKDGNIIDCKNIKQLRTFGIEGEVVVGPLTETTNYSVVCSRENNSVSNSTMVIVNNSGDFTYPQLNIKAKPNYVKYGASSSIEWEVKNAKKGELKILNQDFLFKNECKINGETKPCDEIRKLNCNYSEENANSENDSCKNVKCEQNGKEISCAYLDKIKKDELKGSFILEGIKENISITAIYAQEDGNTASSSAYIYVESQNQCEDGIDNDGDKKIDRDDPSCYKNFDISDPNKYDPKLFESLSGFIPECGDGVDNELINGGLADGADDKDPDCYDKDGNYDREILFESGGLNLSNPKPECSDGLDNDGDKNIDKNDPECHADKNPLNDKSYVADHYSESVEITYLPQCSDFKDNDNDGKIDEEDPGCHEGGIITNKYLPEYSSESANEKEPNFCADFIENPIEFTEEQQDELNKLLREFYLIASTLRTENDIVRIYNETDQQQKLIGDIKELSKQCEADPVASRLTKHGNPWYSPDGKDGVYAYTNSDTGYSTIEWLKNNDYDKTGVGFPGNGNSCEVISGYYYGKTTKPLYVNTDKSFFGFELSNNSRILKPEETDCSLFNGLYVEEIGTINEEFKINNENLPKGNCEADPFSYLKDIDQKEFQMRKAILSVGCKWKDGVDIKKTEQLLKIW